MRELVALPAVAGQRRVILGNRHVVNELDSQENAITTSSEAQRLQRAASEAKS